jgi:hypothetical protein
MHALVLEQNHVLVLVIVIMIVITVMIVNVIRAKSLRSLILRPLGMMGCSVESAIHLYQWLSQMMRAMERFYAIAALILGNNMSKQDSLYVYTVGKKTADYSYIFIITHELDKALELFHLFAIDGDNNEFDSWNDAEDLYIHKSSCIVSEYLSANSKNITREQAESLASNHGFKLDEIYPWKNL